MSVEFCNDISTFAMNLVKIYWYLKFKFKFKLNWYLCKMYWYHWKHSLISFAKKMSFVISLVKDISEILQWYQYIRMISAKLNNVFCKNVLISFWMRWYHWKIPLISFTENMPSSSHSRRISVKFCNDISTFRMILAKLSNVFCKNELISLQNVLISLNNFIGILRERCQRFFAMMSVHLQWYQRN